MLDTENKKWSNQNQYVTLINYDIWYIPLSHYSSHSGSSKLLCHHFRRTTTQSSCTRNDSGSPEGEVCQGNICRTTPLNSNWLSCVHSQHIRWEIVTGCPSGTLPFLPYTKPRKRGYNTANFCLC